MSFTIPVITIDGSSGCGKGTISQRLAQHLSWNYLDSGALYRVPGWAILQGGMDIEKEEAKLPDFIKGLDIKFLQDASLSYRVFCNQLDVTDAIRSEACGSMASKIGAVKEVRECLIERQRDFRQLPGLVTDGRDMGTVIFPDSTLKFYLTASLEERANRRYKQLKVLGIDVSLREIQKDLSVRDERDSNRVVAPLKLTSDMVMVDTTGLTIDEVFEIVLKSVRSRGF